jgi:hypothetical protein
MEPGQLTLRSLRRHLVLAGIGVVALTAVGAALGELDPQLAGHVAPHPVLTGSVGDAASILANNGRVLSAPFLAVLLGFPESGLGRRAGDAVALLIASASCVPVGIALGRWQAALVQYTPQLPFEWAALIVAITAWMHARRSTAHLRDVAVFAIVTTALLISAATIETWCTPHRADGQVAVAVVKASRHG